MRNAKKLTTWMLALLITLFGFGMTACSVEQTEEGQLPEVDVEVREEGQLPKYDVEAQDVDIEMEERTVTVPDIDIGEEDDEVEPPQGDSSY